VQKSEMAALADLWASVSEADGTAKRVHETLRRGILEQILEPGRRLAEEELAEALGVSRTPIREAITRLEAEGIVERSSVRTVTVIRLSPVDVAEVFEVRQWLDGAVAYLAAQRITPPEVAEARWINERMRDAAKREDFAAMDTINREFHDALALAADNDFLLSLMRQARDRVRPLLGTTFAHPGRAQKALAEHDRIIDTIEAGDAEAAAVLARNHMRAAAETRLTIMGSKPRS